ncbi:serine/threonine-protein kinase [Mycoplasma sp. 128]|uniref:serine/threonine-protein kinase n=1 Tax=Mycoplasma sp. 3341 TaxID=3447506 RepID=UPI003F656A90
MNVNTQKMEEKYEIVSEIGTGGMGSVFLCRSRETLKQVAVKVIKSDHSTIEKQRFISEIETMKQIKSNYVVRYYDAEIDDNVSWIVMEYVEGTVLKDLIKKTGGLETGLAITLAKYIALGLADIHSAGIIHRDLKSSNIIQTKTGSAKIIDFGIALNEASPRLTQVNKVVGTPEYIAPELIEKTQGPSVQSDIYSFGILLYEMLEGHNPYSNVEGMKNQLLSHVNQEIPKLTNLNRTIPMPVQNIINKCCAKKPEDRYESCFELYNDLNTCLDPYRAFESEISFSKNKKKTSFEWFHNKKFTVSLIVVTAVLFAIFVAILIYLAVKG